MLKIAVGQAVHKIMVSLRGSRRKRMFFTCNNAGRAAYGFTPW